MAGYNRNAIKAYANVGFETGINSASPHQLITLLFDGILVAISKAKQHMISQEILEKNEAISKATLLIDSGLRAGLNLEQGGELARNLDDLYNYMLNRLMLAHLNNQPELLDEVYGLLTDIKDAWTTIGVNNQSESSQSPQSFTIST
jgi:flagellar protein FliS